MRGPHADDGDAGRRLEVATGERQLERVGARGADDVVAVERRDRAVELDRGAPVGDELLVGQPAERRGDRAPVRRELVVGHRPQLDAHARSLAAS